MNWILIRLLRDCNLSFTPALTYIVTVQYRHTSVIFFLSFFLSSSLYKSLSISFFNPTIFFSSRFVFLQSPTRSSSSSLIPFVTPSSFSSSLILLRRRFNSLCISPSSLFLFLSPGDPITFVPVFLLTPLSLSSALFSYPCISLSLRFFLPSPKYRFALYLTFWRILL